jgi:glycosyltransferase involved in cell wall biosynthesis
MNMSISSIILTKNEVSNIERCIASLKWCREVIVVDSGSTDGTLELAQKLGAIVYTNIQKTPYQAAKQRNWAIDNTNAVGEWILFVDADETIPPDLAVEIQKTCSASDNKYNAFKLTPRYLFWGKWMKRTQGYPNWHDRLLKTGEVRFADGGYWEHFESNIEVGKIIIPYDHFGNSKGISSWIEKHDRYSSAEAEKIVEFLETQEPDSLGTKNKLTLRIWAAKLWLIRPIVKFLYMYVIRLGFLEGLTSLVFCTLYTICEFFVVVKVIELKRKKSGLPL